MIAAARRVPPAVLPGVREKDWQATVEDLAALFGWELRYHTRDSRGSVAGFPDLVLIRGSELLIAELKTDAARSRVTPAQQAWLDGFAACGVEVHVWRPRDFDVVRERLSRRAA